MTLARRKGIRVIADGRLEEAETIRNHGADEVVTRALASNSDSGRRQAVESSGVLDSALIGSALYPCIADCGILACVRTFDGAPPERGIRVREVWARERLLDTAGLTELTASPRRACSISCMSQPINPRERNRCAPHDRGRT